MKKTPAKKAAGKAAAKKTAIKKPAKPRSRQIHARKSKDAQFMDLLRRKCVRAASIGALTAGAEAIPGLGRALGFLFGELVDATMLSNVQRELVDEVFAIYDFKLSDSRQSTLVNKIHIVGAGASVTADTAIRGLLKRGLGRAGSLLTYRLMPVLPIMTSALTNAAITYAVGKRAQAIAKLGDASTQNIPDVLRALSGIDERHVFDWTMSAIKGSTGSLANAFTRIRTTLTPRRKKKSASVRTDRSR